MSRTKNSRIKLLEKLYKDRDFLKAKLALQQETFERTGADWHEVFLTKLELEGVNKQINNFEDI